MKTSNRTLKANHKIVLALDALQKRYSFTKFHKWNGHLIASEFKIGTQFAYILQKLGMIETKFGQVRLTEKVNMVRPSTIRKEMNSYAASCAARKSTVQPKVKSVNIEAEGSFNDIIIALKKQVRKEVLSELLATLK